MKRSAKSRSFDRYWMGSSHRVICSRPKSSG
jgi:hypothetical protein